MSNPLVSSSLKGRRVKMIAYGDNTVKDFDGCIGEVIETNPSGMNVRIEQGWSKGNSIYFGIGGSGFRYELYPSEWDI